MSFSPIEMMLKNLMKGINFPELQERLLSDERVIRAMELATDIRNDFATIKKQNAEILSRLDEIQAGADSPKRKPKLAISQNKD